MRLINMGIDHRRILADTSEQVRDRAIAAGLPPLIPLAYQSWVRAGCEVVMVDHGVVAALEGVDVREVRLPEHTIQIALPPSADAYAVLVGPWSAGMVVAGGYDAQHRVCVVEAEPLPILRAILRALADERVELIPISRQQRTTLRLGGHLRGARIRRLRLGDDLAHVIRREAVGGGGGGSTGGPRGPVAAHVVREHTARVWVARLAPGEHPEVEAKTGLPVQRRSSTGTVLWAVRRPRRGHVRGEGEPRARVSRLTPR